MWKTRENKVFSNGKIAYFQAIKWGGGEVKLKLKYEIVKSKISSLQRKILNKSSEGNINKIRQIWACATFLTKASFIK